MLILLGCCFVFTIISIYKFYHLEIKKGISEEINFLDFIFDWGFDHGLITRIFVYSLLYTATIYFYQFGFTLLILLFSRFEVHVAFTHHHFNCKK